MVSGCDQSDEFSMLDGDDESTYAQHILKMGHCWQILRELTVQLEYFDRSVLG